MIANIAIVVVGVGIAYGVVSSRNDPETHAGIMEHFKYGSIGSEGNQGVPYSLWLALPRAFPQHLPKGRGQGYERLGFIYEPRQRRPIGTSYRAAPLGQVGLNCAVCHTSMVREAPRAAPRVVLGMPANQFNLQAYVKFLRACGADSRFDADALMPEIRRADPSFGFLDELVYRMVVIPRTREALRRLADDFGWMDRRPAQGPGRVDTFNPYKVLFKIDLARDDTVGTADLPALWNQRPRRGMQLHWDGNNDRVEERNISAAIGAGASPESLDDASMARIAEWIMDFGPPSFPVGRIDAAAARRGERTYDEQCAACHSLTGPQVGRVTPIEQIGTDRERLDSFSPELARNMNKLGEGRPWRFSHFRKTNGYANMPLDEGTWLRAPYLHNGSVPDVRSLLSPAAQRPKVFYRGYDVYDFETLGFVSQGPQAAGAGFRFDTTLRGNGNGGHAYGTRLSERDKDDLIEYLKGL